MLSKMAMEDIAALRADGIDVPPREVVRLNALGLRAERGPDSLSVFAAPRVAFLGDSALYEPTLGAEMWLRQAADAFNVDDEQTWFALRVLSCSRPWRDLPDPAKRKAVMKAIRETLKALSAFTIRQVENALAWCIDGDVAEKGEKPPPRPVSGDTSPDDADEIPPRYSPEFGLFLRGTALRIGTAADMKGMTYSMMVAACDRAEAATGMGFDIKAEKGTALGDYMRALDAVRSAHQDWSQTTTKPTRNNMTSKVTQPRNICSKMSDVVSSEGDLSLSSVSDSSRLERRPQTASIGVIAEGV